MLLERNKNGSYSQEGKDAYHYALITTMIWVGENYKGKEQREYIKRLKKNNVYDFLAKKNFVGKLTCFLMDIYLYYPVKPVLKKISKIIKSKGKK